MCSAASFEYVQGKSESITSEGGKGKFFASQRSQKKKSVWNDLRVLHVTRLYWGWKQRKAENEGQGQEKYRQKALQSADAGIPRPQS